MTEKKQRTLTRAEAIEQAENSQIHQERDDARFQLMKMAGRDLGSWARMAARLIEKFEDLRYGIFNAFRLYCVGDDTRRRFFRDVIQLGTNELERKTIFGVREWSVTGVALKSCLLLGGDYHVQGMHIVSLVQNREMIPAFVTELIAEMRLWQTAQEGHAVQEAARLKEKEASEQQITAEKAKQQEAVRRSRLTELERSIEDGWKVHQRNGSQVILHRRDGVVTRSKTIYEKGSQARKSRHMVASASR
jgi:hypothetical protein